MFRLSYDVRLLLIPSFSCSKRQLRSRKAGILFYNQQKKINISKDTKDGSYNRTKNYVRILQPNIRLSRLYAALLPEVSKAKQQQ